MGKLANALRKKFDSPRAALKALGVDQSLLDPNDTDDDNESERMLLRHRGMSREAISTVDRRPLPASLTSKVRTIIRRLSPRRPSNA